MSGMSTPQDILEMMLRKLSGSISDSSSRVWRERFVAWQNTCPAIASRNSNSPRVLANKLPFVKDAVKICWLKNWTIVEDADEWITVLGSVRRMIGQATRHFVCRLQSKMSNIFIGSLLDVNALYSPGCNTTQGINHPLNQQRLQNIHSHRNRLSGVSFSSLSRK